MNAARAKLLVDYFEKISRQLKRIGSIDCLSESSIQANFSQINFKENVAHFYSDIYKFNKNQSGELTYEKSNLYPIKIDPIVQSVSPSGKYRVVLQNVTDKVSPAKKNMVIEIYDQSGLIQQVKVDEFHERIENNAVQGKPFQWNKGETQFVYVATPKAKVYKSFLDATFEKEEEYQDALKLNEYVQDCGEQLVGIIKPKLYVYDIEQSQLLRINIDDSLIPCHPSFVDEQRIVFQALKVPNEFLYGIIHCFNRQTDIYLIESIEKDQIWPKPKAEEKKKDEGSENKEEPKEKKFQTLKKISQSKAGFKPSVSPDGKKILYFGGDIRPSHLNYLSINLIDLETFNDERIVSYSMDYAENTFLGVCGYYDDLKESFWLKDNKHYIFTSTQDGSSRIFALNTESRQVSELSKPSGESHIKYRAVLLKYDTQNNLIYYLQENNVTQPQVYVISNIQLLKDLTLEQYKDQIKVQPIFQSVQNDTLEIQNNLVSNYDERIFHFDGARGYLWSLKDQPELKNLSKEQEQLWANNPKLDPRSVPNSQKPLIVAVHGGPHGCTTPLFSLQRSFYLLNGFNVLSPDFTGSCGYGQQFVEDLLGKIGEKDTNQIIHLVKQVVEQKMCDPNKVIVMGGSYGGYMSGIMAARHPDVFKSAILLNPCLNLPFMMNITDIPDWVSAEVLMKQDDIWNCTPEDYAEMLRKSPMLSPAKIPVLLLVGVKDKRVPWQSALSYMAQAKSAGTPIRTYVYPESNHNLNDSLNTEFDTLLKTITFIEESIQ